MPRVAPKSPVDPKVFRHIVVITLALTFLIAMFSTGENREEFEKQLAEKSEKKRLEQLELEMAKQGKGGNTGLVFKDNRGKKSSWRADSGNTEIQYVPTEGAMEPGLVADSGPQFIDMPNAAGDPGQTTTAAPPGMSGQAINALKKKKKKAKPANPLRRPPPTEGEEESW